MLVGLGVDPASLYKSSMEHLFYAGRILHPVDQASRDTILSDRSGRWVHI